MRNEFNKATKRERLLYSGKICEADGPWYGRAGKGRCNADLSYGVDFDHLILDTNSKYNSFENCRAVCRKCHDWKTNNHDKPLAAKTQRQQDKHNGVKKTKTPWPSRKFSQERFYNTKHIERE
jgi:hypothetical protein